MKTLRRFGEHVETLLHKGGTPAEREAAEQALLRVAQDETQDPSSAEDAGEALAEIYYGQGRLYEAPLPEFTEPAYLGFDRKVTDLQTGAR